MKIEQSSAATISQAWGEIDPRVGQAKSLQDAAQELATAVYKKFDESIVIDRLFFTVPFDRLPPADRAFVEKLADSAGAKAGLKGTTPVLSLMGTRGQEADWNDRRKSKGHLGIPLISSAFVGAIPMISRLLRELGVPLDWVDRHDAQTIVKTMGRAAGLFFVENAGEATDHQGRKIIAAQDFVSKYGVQSVFGVGGAYPGGEIIVLVVFCRDLFPRAKAEGFLPLADHFRDKTSPLVGGGKVYSAG